MCAFVARMMHKRNFENSFLTIYLKENIKIVIARHCLI
jgi:hypothetical protein